MRRPAYDFPARLPDLGKVLSPGPLIHSYRGDVGMTKAELVDQVAETVQLPKNKTEAIITGFLQSIKEALQEGNKVELRGFGSFRLRHRQARAGRNPRTGTTIQLPAKTVPAFTAAKAFKETVQTGAASDATHDLAAYKQTTFWGV